MTRFDEVLWDQAERATSWSLAQAAAAAMAHPVEQIVISTIMADIEDPVIALHVDRAEVELRRLGRTSLLKIGDERGDFVIGVWPTAHEGVFHLVGSVPATDARWRKIERWISNAAPLVVHVFLDHADFVDIGAALSEFGDVEVSRLTARKRSDLSSLNRGWPARSGWRPSPQDAVQDAENEGASVRTLTLHVANVINLHLRRVAGATYYSGDFLLFQRLVLDRLAIAASRRRGLLSGRARQVDMGPSVPITIQLGSPVLIDAQATGEVLTELERQRDTAIAVLHRNPYLHVVVTDYSDGSNFDVFVTSPEAIEVHPGFRASLGALTRLTQALGDRFAAVEIAEAVPIEPVSLDDLVAHG